MSSRELNFRRLELEDIAAVRPYFENLLSSTCDYTVGGMFMWRRYFSMEYAMSGGVFFSRLMGTDGLRGYNIPLASEAGGLVAGIARVADYTRSRGEPLRFCTVPEEYLPFFRDVPGASFRVIEQREFFDYAYDTEDFTGLEGGDYSVQRNHINHFMRFAREWDYQDINEENLQETITFFRDYYRPSGERMSESKEEENDMTLEVLENMSLYGMRGGVLSVNRVVVGFSLCETVGGTLFVHVEKADRDVPGAYPMLAWMTAKRFAGAEGIKLINREEDMGDAGLRQSKISWRPARMLKKYILQEKTQTSSVIS